MAVERVDYSSDDEYQQALQEEEKYYQSQQEPEPDVVPCQGCGCQMYQEREDLKYNFCQKCKNIINGVVEKKEDDEIKIEDIPF